MFIRSSRPQGRTYLRLVEGYRDAPGWTRQRQIAQLGRADQLTEDKVQSIIRGLKRHTGVPLVDGESAEFEPSRSLGDAWLLTETGRARSR